MKIHLDRGSDDFRYACLISEVQTSKSNMAAIASRSLTDCGCKVVALCTIMFL